MSFSTNSTVGARVLTAFFDTEDAAKKASEDLIAAGIPREHITQTTGEGAAAETAGDHRGFWEQLKDFLLPDADRHSYAEGLRRGGTLVKVQADEANYTRVLDILDTDGAVDMDHREGEWRSTGWSGYASSPDLSVGANPLAGIGDTARVGEAAYGTTRMTTTSGITDGDWQSDEVARAAALDGSVAATAAAARDDSHGRSRLRSYRFAEEPGEGRPRSFSAGTDAARIVEHMDVISADGQTIGTVDHLDGVDRIKLTKTGSPDGQHHIVPFTWIDHVDQHVHLRKTLAEIKAQQ